MDRAAEPEALDEVGAVLVYTDEDPEADLDNLDVSMMADSMDRSRAERETADILHERIDGSRGE